ncbi:MAG TPA: DUF4412 domain-containing protein [Nitrospiraceae bacterium]|nr:DUF4412 domain-containing protein [Nitrospiraceae bacterium]
MCLRRIAAACLAIIGLPWLGYAGDFEGVIRMRSTTMGTPEQYRLYLKGDRLRLENETEAEDKGVLVFDAKARQGFGVEPDDQLYYVFPMEELPGDVAKKLLDDVLITRTGKTKKVAGQVCDLYVAKGKADGMSEEVCLANGLGNPALVGLMTGDARSPLEFPSWLLDLAKARAFPLRVIVRSKDGQEESRLEATKVEPRGLEDSLFTPPPGYKRMDNDTLMGGTGHGEAVPAPGAAPKAITPERSRP